MNWIPATCVAAIAGVGTAFAHEGVHLHPHGAEGVVALITVLGALALGAWLLRDR
ncbi:MAG: hypothetical protein AAGG56_03120 [Pseudomonadota bacterium]